MSVSIRDVAKEAGVSLATVSKVLNSRAGSRIASSTQTRVRETAALLGYLPNKFAQSMAVRRTNTVALLISGLQNPFFLHILEESEKLLMAGGYQAIVDAAPSVNGTYVSHGKMSGWPVDGVLMWAGVNQKATDILGAPATELPVVYLGYPREDDSSWVAFDLYQGGALAADFLISKGHTDIGFIHPWDTNQMSRFPAYSGFADRCRKVDVRLRTFGTVRQEETQRSGRETGLLVASMPPETRPKAIFCHNDVIAIGVYHCLIRGGVRVPEDIALIGFDGTEEGQCLDKPLTSVLTPVDVFCRHAVDVLMNRLAGTVELSPDRILVPAELLIGETA